MEVTLLPMIDCALRVADARHWTAVGTEGVGHVVGVGRARYQITALSTGQTNVGILTERLGLS